MDSARSLASPSPKHAMLMFSRQSLLGWFCRNPVIILPTPPVKPSNPSVKGGISGAEARCGTMIATVRDFCASVGAQDAQVVGEKRTYAGS